ncbi:MAG TPA: bifunctional precorrin-2 dehydrogenase/sirohydrochlorin ferrochelatase [Thermodesulfovibrionales bacterium]|nr:bifunctional precorrin-2 dehydrogenase/sirohydrochlorin ferrochelatase [Thermodesulfovibrionales bacterium]
MNYYPAFLNISGKKAVIVGGGSIAERKAITLIRTGAKVTVISPTLTARLSREKKKNTIRHIARRYRKGDLKGSFLVIAATDTPAVNSKVAREAPSLVNVVDVPGECTFIAPSIVRRGPLTMAISTAGKSPAFARTLRRELERTYGPALGAYLEYMGRLRKEALAGICDRKKRERFLKDLASDRVLRLLRTKGLTYVKEKAEEQRLKLAASCRP